MNAHWITRTLFILGGLSVLFSLGAELFQLDITPGFGIIQMFQLLIGISFITLASLLHIKFDRTPKKERTPSLQAEIGVRLAATGLVLAYVAGLSDLIGIGTHSGDQFPLPFVGPVQLTGLLVAVGIIIVGILIYWTSRGSRKQSLLGFLIKE